MNKKILHQSETQKIELRRSLRRDKCVILNWIRRQGITLSGDQKADIEELISDVGNLGQEMTYEGFIALAQPKRIPNWGNGWEWEEKVSGRYPTLSLDWATRWFTTGSYGERSLESIPGTAQHGVGASLRFRNRAPVKVVQVFAFGEPILERDKPLASESNDKKINDDFDEYDDEYDDEYEEE